VHRPLDYEPHADCSRQVNRHITAVDQLGYERLVCNRSDAVSEATATSQVGDIVHGAGGQVIENEDLITALEKALG
jgi:hypothetical protein